MNKTVASDHLYRTLSMYFGLFVAIGCFLVLPFFVPGVWPYTSILVPVIFALILSFFWKPFCYRLHQKGYTPPIFLSLFLILYAGPLAVGYILLIIINHLSNLWNVAMLSVLIGLAGPAAALLILTVLPKKHWRSWGKRQAMFPFRLLGLLALGLGMIWLIAYLCRGLNIHNLGYGIQGLIWFYTISSILFYFARRQNLPSLEEVVTKDPRAPVVYLRSFSDEGKVFVYTVGDELR
ncbi:MAG TPA: hypothetical protein VFM18_21230, partial [Methanosarcina sp.]|nr:hypothetical protein [Methanosarcina sp.]